jgi:hypothetical protein
MRKPKSRSVAAPLPDGLQPDPVWKRLEKYPKWIRDYIRNVQTFIGAPEVAELTFLREQNKALIRLVRELKAESQRLQRRLAVDGSADSTSQQRKSVRASLKSEKARRGRGRAGEIAGG